MQGLVPMWWATSLSACYHHSVSRIKKTFCQNSRESSLTGFPGQDLGCVNHYLAHLSQCPWPTGRCLHTVCASWCKSGALLQITLVKPQLEWLSVGLYDRVLENDPWGVSQSNQESDLTALRAPYLLFVWHSTMFTGLSCVFSPLIVAAISVSLQIR